jgi:predicted phosphatase
LLNEHEKFIFDLDRTVWDTYDVTGRPIWAKQLIEPLRIEGDRIVDDVGYYCILTNGVKDFITLLSLQDKNIGYLSVGALYGVSDNEQPSLKILKLFGLYDMFNYKKILSYKTEPKKEHLRAMAPCVFFDDDEKHIKAAASLEGVLEIDSKNIEDWRKLK